MKQTELADILGVHFNTLSRWENTKPPKSRVSELAKILELNEPELYEQVERDHTPEGAGDPKDKNDLFEVIYRWRNAISMAMMDPFLRLVLGSLPVFMDMETGVIAVTIQQIIETTHINADRVHEVWPEVLASPFVERVGKVEYMFKLRFPDK